MLLPPGEEHWLGLDSLHFFTSQRNYSLKLTLEDQNGQVKTALYSSFKVSDAVRANPLDTEENSTKTCSLNLLSLQPQYKLSVEGYNNGTGEEDSLDRANNQPFSAVDMDQDNVEFNCARRFQGAWW